MLKLPKTPLFWFVRKRTITDLKAILLTVETFKIDIKDYTRLSYGEVIEIENAYQYGGTIEASFIEPVMLLMYGKLKFPFKQIARLRIYLMSYFKFFVIWNNLKKQVQKEIDHRQKILGGNTTAEEEAAGIKNLAAFGHLMTVDNLSGRDILKHEQIEALDYSYVKLNLVMRARESEFQSNLMEVKKKNAKKQ